MAIIARAIRTITDLFDPIQQGTAPAAPVTGMLWLDTALTPNQLKRWNGTAWVTVNDPAGILTRLNAAETKITDSAIVSTVRSSSEYLADLAGKNRTWLQSTAPTGANVGDLWIDTANGNLLKRWNGTSWANVQDAAVSFAQQTADKISWIIASGTSATNMTLTSQLYSLVSQNVVISADNLTVTARDTLKLEAVEAIQVGGTNLLPGTSDAYANLVYSGTNFLYPISTYFPIANMGLKAGDMVTARAYIKTDANVPAGGLRLAVNNYNGTASIATYYSPDLILPSSEGYSSVTFVIPANATTSRFMFRSYGSINFTGTEQYKRLKLEAGNKATDWSPHPNDPVKGVKTSYITIDNDSIDIASGGTLTLSAADDITIAGNSLVETYAEDIVSEASSSIVSTVKTGISYTGTNLNTDLSNKANTSALASYSTITQTASDITLAVSNIDIGGTNLLTNSGLEYGEIGGGIETYGASTIVSTAYVYGTMSIRTQVTGDGTVSLQRGARINLLNITAEKYYLLSFYAKGYENVKTMNVYCPNVGYQRLTADDMGGGWIKYVYRIISHGGYTIYFRPNGNLNYATDAYFNAPKLEEGNKVTAWSRSPYDPAKGVKTSYINITNDNIHISSGGTFTVGSSNFTIDSSGNVSLKGTITADVGYIGGDSGFTIASQKMYTGSKSSFYSNAAGVYIATNGIAVGGNGTTTPFKVSSDGALTATSGVIGGFNIDASRHYYGDPRPGYGDNHFVDLSKWGMAVGKDASYSNNYFPVRMNVMADGDFGHFMAHSGNIGIAGFHPGAFAIRAWPSNTFYSGGPSGTGRVTKVWIDNAGTIKTKGSIYIEGNFASPSGTISAADYVDFTPGYKGASAIAEIRGVKNDIKGNLDHATLPTAARKKIKKPTVIAKEGKNGEPIDTEEEVEARDLGMMVSILTKAIQELDERLDKLEVTNGKAV